MTKLTKEIKVGNLIVGGNNRITVQSMTNSKTSDIDATVKQIKALENAKCDIVRVSVPDVDSAKAIKEIKSQINIPLVADIHFDYKLAVMSADNGIDKVRINPGNIGGQDKVKYLADYLKERSIPIRIGVNSGSVESDLLEKYGNTPKALVESALNHVKMLEDCNFYDTIISVKSTNVQHMIKSYEQLSQRVDYPLHLGVTEAGFSESGIIKSSVGLGILLNQKIGDTIRVSLPGDPVKEVIVGRKILQSLGHKIDMPEIIACPTCARTNINVEALARDIEMRVQNIEKHIKIAVMGCIVNGPGEGKEADIGVAGGKTKSVIFKKGEIFKTVKNEDIFTELLKEIETL